MKPVVFASLIGAAASVVALWWRYPPPASVPTLVKSVSTIVQDSPADQAEHLLCDKEVDDLLHSKDLVEVTRAGILVNTVNCGIGRRLQMSVK
jgi:hypothetical protein